MTEERVYKLENGKEKGLMSTAIFNDKRYLLLYDNATEEVDVAFEEKGNLRYIEKNGKDFETILSLLYNKLKESEI